MSRASNRTRTGTSKPSAAKPWFARVQWWLVVGLTTYLVTAAVSEYQTGAIGVADALYGIVDWLAASVFYFFCGALVGLVADWVIVRTRKESFRVPDWFWFTIGFWALSVAFAYVIAPNADPSLRAAYPVFPLAYSIFFLAMAFSIFFPKLMTATPYTKLVLDVGYLAVFSGWLWLATRRGPEATRRSRILFTRILLVIIFGLLLIGMVSCAQQLP